jgi:hypothetical protein
MLHPQHQKSILLADNLARHLKDRLGTLVEALNQPGGVCLTLGKIDAIFLARSMFETRAIYWLLTRTRGRVSLFSSTIRVPSGAARTKCRAPPIGPDRHQGIAGLGIEAADFRHHLFDVVEIDFADRLRAAKSRLRMRSRLASSAAMAGRSDRGLSTARPALGKIASKDARRVEGLEHREHAFDVGDIGAERLGYRLDVACEISASLTVPIKCWPISRSAGSEMARTIAG